MRRKQTGDTIRVSAFSATIAVMARLSRVVLPDYPHHVTQRGVRSQAVFFDDDDRRFYLDLMREQTQRQGVHILCYCLMTNHVHLLAVPSSVAGLARAIGEAHRRYTLHINRRSGARGYLFQGRFFSCPLDETHLLSAARYTLRNPVRAGMVARAGDWPWSSAAFHLRECHRDPLVTQPDLPGLAEGAAQWRNWLENDVAEEQMQRLRETSRTGRPCGNAHFLERAEQLSGRNLRPRVGGRPRNTQNKSCD